jgi:hypothetical protein
VFLDTLNLCFEIAKCLNEAGAAARSLNHVGQSVPEWSTDEEVNSFPKLLQYYENGTST